MMDVRAADPSTPVGASVLIYGRGESPMAVLACALARREVGAFRWADGAPASERPEPEALRVLAEGSGQDPGWHVPPGDLDPPGISLEGLRHWLHSEAADIAARLRLEAYLRLPSILQQIVSQAPEPGGRSAIILTNVDALPPPGLESALGEPGTHATLRREGVSMFVTFRGSPPAALQVPFDRIYRIDGQPQQVWQEARVTVERGGGPDELASSRSLSDQLAWLASPGDEAESPHGIPHHRLR
jgi:hypothetical protein